MPWAALITTWCQEPSVTVPAVVIGPLLAPKNMPRSLPSVPTYRTGTVLPLALLAWSRRMPVPPVRNHISAARSVWLRRIWAGTST